MVRWSGWGVKGKCSLCIHVLAQGVDVHPWSSRLHAAIHPEDLQILEVDKGLERLRDHHTVRKATWLPSRVSFKVIRKDKRTSQFRARANLSNQKKRKAEPAQPLQAFHKAIEAALDWAEEKA